MILFIWICLASLEALRHTFLIRYKKISPNKAASLFGRLLIALSLFLIDLVTGQREWYVLGLVYLFSGEFIHSTTIAVGIGRRPWYLNKTGPLDKLQGSGSPYVWILKAIATGTLIAMYYFNY